MFMNIFLFKTLEKKLLQYISAEKYFEILDSFVYF